MSDIEKLENQIKHLEAIKEIADLHHQDAIRDLFEQVETLEAKNAELEATQELLQKRIRLLTGEKT